MSSAEIPRPDDADRAVRAEAERLAASGAGRPGPHLIGVRHHAPSLSAVVPALLDAARPDAVLVELPAEFQPWLGWLADEATEAPVALAAAPAGPEAAAGPAFYPFADFSPELAALRWARRNGVEAIACDLPLAHRGAVRADARRRPDGGPDAPGVADALRHRLTGRDSDEDLWDRLVETAAPGSTPEAVRRAALLVGWALRRDAETGPGVDPYDLRREAWMRARIQAASAGGRRVTAVVGAFHASALLDGPLASEQPPQPDDAGHVLSLIPYTYPLLDARSGYPAGIRDPEWQHTVLDAGGDPDRLAEALTTTAVRICAALRTQDHPSGPADAREIVRLAGDLARLRGHAAPGRGELVEAVQTVLAQGEPLGRGRAVARAHEQVQVGTRTGRPTPAAPRSGLAPAVETLLGDLGLPGPADPGPRDLRLDPLRSDLDRRREILLHRLIACEVPYAEPVATTGAGGTETLGTRWRLHWTPASAAMLTVASTRGVTPAQAAEGALRAHLTDQPTPREIIDGLTAAASCALPALAETRLTQLTTVLPTSATLPELLDALALVDRLTAGHFPGYTPAGGEEEAAAVGGGALVEGAGGAAAPTGGAGGLVASASGACAPGSGGTVTAAPGAVDSHAGRRLAAEGEESNASAAGDASAVGRAGGVVAAVTAAPTGGAGRAFASASGAAVPAGAVRVLAEPAPGGTGRAGDAGTAVGRSDGTGAVAAGASTADGPTVDQAAAPRGAAPALADGLPVVGHLDGRTPGVGDAVPDGPVADGRQVPIGDASADSGPRRPSGPTGRPLLAAGEVLTVAAVRQLEGLGGSDDPQDARALVELVRRADRLGGVRLAYVLAELAEQGSPLVRGAAGAVRVLLGQEPAEVLGGRAASWVDGATGPQARHALGRALVGLLTAAEGLFDSAPQALEPVLERVTSLPDDAFLDRLPALRGGFDTLSPAARDRLLALVEEGLGTRLAALPEEAGPAVLAGWVRADLAARAAPPGVAGGCGSAPPAPRRARRR
ncbi:DUF5682 family protein, partial [Kitasatospora sp. NPDC004799]|uniref:DUF5682 family protein n=1 Tax=Kitasatospora sp. NPDC004799 TaxID=3154460 RepID=UPI0033A06481